MHYMRALRKVIRNRPEIKQALDNCDCDQHKQETNNQRKTYLSLRPESLVEHSCSGHTSHPHLKYWTGSGRSIP